MRPTNACRSSASSYTPLRTHVSMSCGTSSSSSSVACSPAQRRVAKSGVHTLHDLFRQRKLIGKCTLIVYVQFAQL